MTPYERLLQEGFVHNVMLIGNRRELQRRVRDIVQSVERRLQDRLISQAALLSDADINRIRRAVFRGTQRLEELSRRLDGFVGEVSEAIKAEVTAAAKDLAAYEAMFWQDRYSALVSVDPQLAPIINVDAATARTARANVTRAAVITGTIAAGISLYRANRRRRLKNAVATAAQSDGRNGVLGLLNVSDGARARGRLIGETTRNLNISTGDIHTHAASIGAQTFAQTNPSFDLVWTAIIDERTSSICLSRNGQYVNRDLDGLLPPAHINCRSIAVPLILSERLNDAQRGRLRRDTRRAIERGLPDFDSTEKSFNALPSFRQRQILGPVRHRIFEQGGLRFPSDFIGDDEKFINLDDLAQREAIDLSDFRRAA